MYVHVKIWKTQFTCVWFFMKRDFPPTFLTAFRSLLVLCTKEIFRSEESGAMFTPKRSDPDAFLASSLTFIQSEKPDLWAKSSPLIHNLSSDYKKNENGRKIARGPRNEFTGNTISKFWIAHIIIRNIIWVGNLVSLSNVQNANSGGRSISCLLSSEAFPRRWRPCKILINRKTWRVKAKRAHRRLWAGVSLFFFAFEFSRRAETISGPESRIRIELPVVLIFSQDSLLFRVCVYNIPFRSADSGFHLYI